MSAGMAKTGWWLLIVVFAGVAGFSIYRDLQIERQYTADLRNRVVGARFEKIHRSPYFYTWQPPDSIAWYDPSNIATAENKLHVSNITATPFFHHLLAPLADLPERTISQIWLLIEYVLLAICVCIAWALAGSRPQKALVVITTILFLLTEAWQNHIATGQYYLLVPCLALLFYYFFRRHDHQAYAVAAGLCAIVLVLIRPNALVFFLPFLLLAKKYPLRYWIAFLLPVMLLAGWSLADGQERRLWMDYKKLLTESVKIHQGSIAAETRHRAAEPIADWEGWRRSAIDSSFAQHPHIGHSEHGNVFVLYEKIFHRKTNLLLLNLASALTLLLLAGLFLWTHRRENGYDLLQLAVFGFCLYMITDLFSPIWRFQYNTVQWLCPLLLVSAVWKPRPAKWFVLLAIALLLNILNIPFMKMEHTVGEYMILIILLLLSMSTPRPLPFNKSAL